MKTNKLAFTLVELIVVITILAILWTIAFISLQWYSADARDSIRINDIWEISKTLELKMTLWEKVPIPENNIELTASWILIWYQWEAWTHVLDVLWVYNWGKDPSDDNYYTYSTNENLNKYQVLWFLESANQISLNIWKSWYGVNAKDFSARQVYTKWNEIGILMDSISWTPADRFWNNIDVANTTNEYKAKFSWNIEVTWTWGVIYSYFYNRSKKLLIDKQKAKIDKYLLLYMDMESTSLSGTTKIMKDLSGYWNNWSFTWNTSTWLYEWRNSFYTPAESNSEIIIPNNSDFDNLDNLTVSAIAYYDSWSLVDNYTFMLSKIWSFELLYASSYFWTRPNSPYLSIVSGWVWYNTYTWRYSSFPVKKWVYLTAVYDSKNKIDKLYVNGVLADKNVNLWWMIANSLNNIFIWWRWGDYHQSWKGYIDEVRIYKRALSDDEVKTIYESEK